jgi:hypothetical protein
MQIVTLEPCYRCRDPGTPANIRSNSIICRHLEIKISEPDFAYPDPPDPAYDLEKQTWDRRQGVSSVIE